MKKDKLSLLAIIEESKSYEGSFTNFLIEYNADIMETSSDKVLETMYKLDNICNNVEKNTEPIKKKENQKVFYGKMKDAVNDLFEEEDPS